MPCASLRMSIVPHTRCISYFTRLLPASSKHREISNRRMSPGERTRDHAHSAELQRDDAVDAAIVKDRGGCHRGHWSRHRGHWNDHHATHGHLPGCSIRVQKPERGREARGKGRQGQTRIDKPSPPPLLRRRAMIRPENHPHTQTHVAQRQSRGMDACPSQGKIHQNSDLYSRGMDAKIPQAT